MYHYLQKKVRTFIICRFKPIGSLSSILQAEIDNLRKTGQGEKDILLNSITPGINHGSAQGIMRKILI